VKRYGREYKMVLYCAFLINMTMCLFLLAGDPHNIPTATGDPFKTLFVARIVSVTIQIVFFFCLNLFMFDYPT
jgi:hypothetical protein